MWGLIQGKNGCVTGKKGKTGAYGRMNIQKMLNMMKIEMLVFIEKVC